MEKVYRENNISMMFPDASLNVYRVLGLALQRILKNNHIENVDFILLANDYISPPFGTEQLIINAPIFLMSKDLSFQLKKDRLLLPDAYILDDKA